ncbi:hypothetical protein X726_07175 [Mesorhizobium sp. L103C105A0]|nr:hypothetical protein X726_07175 [Mesorhizobium sp. L103C105A0]
MADIGGVMDNFARLAGVKAAFAHAPLGAAGQRNVDLLGNVMMVGIGDAGPQDQQSGRDLFIGEMAARAKHLQPAVVLQERFTKIARVVGLPPAQIVTTLRQQLHQRLRGRRRQFDNAVEQTKARQRMRFEHARRHIPADPGHGVPHQRVVHAPEIGMEAVEQFVEICRHAMLR